MPFVGRNQLTSNCRRMWSRKSKKSLHLWILPSYSAKFLASADHIFDHSDKLQNDIHVALEFLNLFCNPIPLLLLLLHLLLLLLLSLLLPLLSPYGVFLLRLRSFFVYIYDDMLGSYIPSTLKLLCRQRYRGSVRLCWRCLMRCHRRRRCCCCCVDLLSLCLEWRGLRLCFSHLR